MLLLPQLRYANNSNYKNDDIIARQVYLSKSVVDEFKRIIADSEVMKEDDNNWPAPDRVGRQELEVILGGEHVSFTCTKLGSVLQVQNSKDPEGLRIFYYLVQVRGRRRRRWRGRAGQGGAVVHMCAGGVVRGEGETGVGWGRRRHGMAGAANV